MARFPRPPNRESGDDDAPTLADAEAAAVRLLARRAHAEGELRRKLAQRDFDDALIDQACERMHEYGYLDDEQFAADQAAILRRKGWGPRQIAHKLGQRGVDSTIVDDTIAALGGRQDWIEACRQRLESKFRCPADELDDAATQKAFRHLKYRGFHDSTIRCVLFD